MFECGLCNYSDVRMTASTGASASEPDAIYEIKLLIKIINLMNISAHVC